MNIDSLKPLQTDLTEISFVNKENQWRPTNVPVVLGKPVVNVPAWERQQKWIGASIDPVSAEKMGLHPSNPAGTTPR